ncbi:FtsK/SpoIIIE family DNA translocase [Adhaeribacter soli]|uniref:DNA translocase FtsK n=1 Tax=Adhaeribacter soli TaxID=2607655 RepID=A0A5N1J252_9BACT|nr:DNA translocase FtsK [Adhaeribacter soli]KAA9340602.1 DNA translocase FtsK [Adhaeribacter soli]
MAKNTYRNEAGNEARQMNAPRNVTKEPLGRNEFRKSNEPKSEKPKKERKPIAWPTFRFPQISFLKDRRFQLLAGFFFLLTSLYLTIAFVSFLFTGPADQSVVEALNQTAVKDAGLESENWLGLTGAYIANYFINEWVGIGAFFLIPLVFFWGYKIVFRRTFVSVSSVNTFCLFGMLWTSLLCGYLVLSSNTVADYGFFSGGIGYETALWMESIIGWGSILLLAFLLIVFVVFFFNITTLKATNPQTETAAKPRGNQIAADGETYEQLSTGFNHYTNPVANLEEEEEDEEFFEEDEELEEVAETFTVKKPGGNSANGHALELNVTPPVVVAPPVVTPPAPANNLSLQIETPHLELEEFEDEEEFIEEEPVELDVTPLPDDATGIAIENYDPTLDLARYQYPNLELLNDYGGNKIQVSKEELEANKDKIVETLANYSIGIASIKATIGPTVTLYEIVPDAGVRISKIKNLEDDIALSLAALGIRIIAPIPGKGTIGIEVPNKKKEMVAIKSILSTEKFLKSEMDLPIAFGKTITNEVFITDLAKMPHLLMAGATGQGKSVGLNTILTSLLYKKHPSQLKFVLVDPKKVELSLFNKIERHFLAKLPDSEEPIITDTKKVVNTLNSLCMEMDMRYDLLKDAGCRNLKEYNQKFIERRLNPKKGHRFMPFIVLVIDELADLMMTAGKEVETPIARLAQLARAIGIHLVVATQRPSVNVITGIIKANFPCRISFKVTSKIDSRTILDTGGADQLVGQGDMLFSVGSDLIRLQCAFVDTPEVDRICDFIGDQQGYSDAYLLPEFVGDDSGGGEKADFDPSNRDPLFEEAARTIVMHQQGSTSLLQRRLKLGYNRAGRLIDQLEAAGVVGPFEGSKAREVLIPDEYSLEQLLNSMEK